MRAAAPPRRGAALLLAMVLVTVVATLAAGMVWQQWQAVQIEAAERSRVQGTWILRGALDWSRLILREDARSGKPTSLLEPWATPLAEARLSTFLAAGGGRDGDVDNSDIDLDAFLSGGIVDAQARYNLRNLFNEGRLVPAQFAALQRLCEATGVPVSVATQLAEGLAMAWFGGLVPAADPPAAAGASGSAPTAAPPPTPAPTPVPIAGADSATRPLAPQRFDDLIWLGIDPASLQRLSTVAVLLPLPTPLNLNTAPREVLAAVLPGLDLGAADRLVQARERAAFNDPASAAALLGGSMTLAPPVADVRSSWFEVTGRMRLGDRVLTERSLLMRRGLDILVMQTERSAGFDTPATR